MSSRIKEKAISLKSSGVDLGSRLALRPKEAAEALGISERKLREMLPELPHIRRGGVVMLPVMALRRWLDDEAKARTCRSTEMAEEILSEIRGNRQ